MECISLHEILGGESVFDLKIGNRLDLMELSGKGLTKEQLLNLSQFLELPVAKIAELLPVSERTIARHKPDETFGRAVSEHILQIAETIACGMNVFENRENLIAWLNLPNHALGDKSPMSLLISRFGMEMVLGRTCSNRTRSLRVRRSGIQHNPEPRAPRFQEHLHRRNRTDSSR